VKEGIRTEGKSSREVKKKKSRKKPSGEGTRERLGDRGGSKMGGQSPARDGEYQNQKKKKSLSKRGF